MIDTPQYSWNGTHIEEIARKLNQPAPVNGSWIATIAYALSNLPTPVPTNSFDTFDDLPAASSAANQFVWVKTSTGTQWVPSWLGGNYKPKGLYYSDGTTWQFTEIPFQATDAEALAGTNTSKFITPASLKWVLDNFPFVASYTSTVKHAVKLDEVISKGKAVYVSGADGTNILVKKASNDTEATSSKTLGLLETGGVINDQVFVVTEGLLAGLDTTAATIGDGVYLGVSGNLVYGHANKPTAPAHLVYIGVVTRVHATQGEIFVHVQNGFELDELHDVKISSKAYQQAILYNPTTSLWENGWTWMQYVTGWTKTTPPTLISDTGGVKKYEYTYNFGTRYRKLSATEDDFYLELACTNLIVQRQIS